MNKNTTAVLLIIIAVAIYFTFTKAKVDELKSIVTVNKQYQQAIDNSKKLVEKRDEVLERFNSISEADRQRLNKLVPDNVDNVQLIMDVKDDIAARHGLSLKNIKTASPESESNPNTEAQPLDEGPRPPQDKYGVVSLTFDVTAGYEPFVNFLRDLEASLRLMDVSKLTVKGNEKGTYDFSVEIKTYWLKQE